MKIAIDYGHTLVGADTGAVGNGLKEQVVTRDIGGRVTSKLRALGHTVIETHLDSSSSVGESLAHRCNIANNNSVDLFASIHVNAGGGFGTEIYTYGGREVPEARNILNNICALGFRNRGIKDGSSLYVIRNTKMKSMLIETFFIDTNDTERYKRVGAEGIANAIVKGISGKLPTPIKQENREEKKVKTLVVYYYPLDQRAAEYVADKLNCPTMLATRKFDYSCVENVIAVGGNENNYKECNCKPNKIVSGTNRYDTLKAVVDYIK